MGILSYTFTKLDIGSLLKSIWKGRLIKIRISWFELHMSIKLKKKKITTSQEQT